MPEGSPEEMRTDSERQAVLLVYILYLIGFATGISAFAGVVIAHTKQEGATPPWDSHYRYLIRTFWLGLVQLAIGVVMTMVFVGIVIIFWWAFWTGVRCVKGLLRTLDDEPIKNPDTLLW
ncbi:hypothetical protein K6118_09040 [Kordiimonas sp. A6E486]|nr:hypothetical protein [Kordiimonas marina]